MSTEGRVLRETSFGGVAVRGGDVLVITPAGKRVTTLPKGGADDGESGEETAAREVREETGVTVRVREPLGDVQITATQADLAKLAGSSRESASRFLAVLERAGVISQGRGRLVVHDPPALGGYVY